MHISRKWCAVVVFICHWYRKLQPSSLAEFSLGFSVSAVFSCRKTQPGQASDEGQAIPNYYVHGGSKTLVSAANEDFLLMGLCGISDGNGSTPPEVMLLLSDKEQARSLSTKQ